MNLLRRIRALSKRDPACTAALWAAVCAVVLAPDARGQQAARATREVRFEQKLDQQIPLDVLFRDETGAEVRLGEYFREKPVVLTLVYYSCPMLCTQVLNGLSTSLKHLDGLAPGADFEIVTISIDAREGPELSAQKKAGYVKALGKPGAEQGWHFLTGTEDSIRRVADAVGFRYFYDEGIDEFAHPGGIVVATPGGRISRYFFDVVFPERDLRLALVESSEGRIGTWIDSFTLLCYHYDPKTGKYGLAIFNTVRLLGALTVLVIGGYILTMLRRDRRVARLGANA